MTASVTDCTCFNLRKAARAVTQYYDDALRPSGLRVTQFSLLSVIKQFGTVNIGTLADEAVMDRTTLTRNLKLLEQEGLVTVTAGDDARVREVSLTAAAQEQLAERPQVLEKSPDPHGRRHGRRGRAPSAPRPLGRRGGRAVGVGRVTRAQYV